MLTTTLTALALILVAILGYAAGKPPTFFVERTTTVNAPANKIFPYINDLHQWDHWTPYNKDPAMQKTYSGSDSGQGAHYAWSGDKTVGQGTSTISESVSPSKVVLDLHFIVPFEAHNTAVFTLDPQGSATRVTWSMDGKSSFVFKVMGIFINMDNMIGKDFEVGLARLKAVAEK
jgi:hypothetical protein